MKTFALISIAVILVALDCAYAFKHAKRGEKIDPIMLKRALDARNQLKRRTEGVTVAMTRIPVNGGRPEKRDDDEPDCPTGDNHWFNSSLIEVSPGDDRKDIVKVASMLYFLGALDYCTTEDGGWKEGEDCSYPALVCDSMMFSQEVGRKAGMAGVPGAHKVFEDTWDQIGDLYEAFVMMSDYLQSLAA